MKKTRLLLLALTLVLALSTTMLLAACDSGSAGSETSPETVAPVTQAPTTPVSENATQAPTTEAPVTNVASAIITDAAATEAPTETNAAVEDTDAPDDSNIQTDTVDTEAPVETAEEDTEAEEETIDLSKYDSEDYIVIATPDDLLELNRSINQVHETGDEYFIEEKTIVFVADIDMAGHIWEPIDGQYLCDVTFDGLGHAIKNLTMEYNVNHDYEPNVAGCPSCGFIDLLSDGCGEITFKDITFEGTTITAYNQCVAAIIGRVQGAGIGLYFNNVTVNNLTIDGWPDYDNQDAENGGHPIAMRVAGFVGGVWGTPYIDFDTCTVSNAKMSGYHNLAGFIGYDASGMINEQYFNACKVQNVEMTFGYMSSATYSNDGAYDRIYKLSAVFFNQAQWIDMTDACLENGNEYSSVTFYDFVRDNLAIDAADFRSWSQEEGEALGFAFKY